MTNIFVVSLELVPDAPSVEHVDKILALCLTQIFQFYHELNETSRA
jgi:hypothetical protein